MSYCENCGLKIEEGDFTCKNCGKKIIVNEYSSVAYERLLVRENELKKEVKKWETIEKVIEGIVGIAIFYLWIIKGYGLINVFFALVIILLVLYPFLYLLFLRPQKKTKKEYQNFMDKKLMMEVLKEKNT